eukprot:256113-Amphidinium_carterae.1
MSSSASLSVWCAFIQCMAIGNTCCSRGSQCQPRAIGEEMLKRRSQCQPRAIGEEMLKRTSPKSCGQSALWKGVLPLACSFPFVCFLQGPITSERRPLLGAPAPT